MKKPSRHQQFADFKRDFSNLCRDWRGVESPADAIGDGAAFRFQTSYGELHASIHAPIDSLGDYKNASRFQFCMGSIYLCFDPYTGPLPCPLTGDINQFSHKWNIHRTGPPQPVQPINDSAMSELVRRLSLVTSKLQTA